MSQLAILIHHDCYIYSNKCETILTLKSEHNSLYLYPDAAAGFPVCLAGTVGTGDLHYTVHAQQRAYRVELVQKNVRARWEGGWRGEGGQELFQFCWSAGNMVGTFQAGFTVTMKTEVRVNTPDGAGTTSSPALRPLTKENKDF